MRLFKDKHSITLNEVSVMFDREDPTVLRRFAWVPAAACRRYYTRFMIEFSELFNRNEINDLLSDDILRFKIVNTALLYLPMLYNGLLFSSDERFRELFKEKFGKDYTAIEDLKVIITEIDRLKGKLKELGTPQQVVESKGVMSFERVIDFVEQIRDLPIDRNIRLFQFKELYDGAVAKARQLEKARAK